VLSPGLYSSKPLSLAAQTDEHSVNTIFFYSVVAAAAAAAAAAAESRSVTVYRLLEFFQRKCLIRYATVKSRL